MYSVEVGYWNLTDEMCAQLREYLLRGGFLMVDDFHGTIEWNNFMACLSKVFPDRPVLEIDNKDAIFHVIYDLDDRYQVPGAQWLQTGSHYEYDGYAAEWRGVYDDHGRINGRDLPQYGPGRRVGMVGRSAVSGEVGVARVPDRG